MKRSGHISLGWLSLLSASALVFFLAGGCNCGGPPPKTDTSKAEGTVTDTQTDANGGETAPDQSKHCTTPCDCPQGQACENGSCQLNPTPTYCCDRDGCPQGVRCIDTNGDDGTCGLRKKCTHACDCPQKNACINGQCTATDTPTYCCEKSGCAPGQACVSLRGGTKVCGGEGQPCVSVCDCQGGFACINGQCTKSSTPVYCCDSANCPKGETCETSKGNKGICGHFQPCKSACDCPSGQACNNNRCEATPVPVYCCDKADQCPSGQACDTTTGQRQTCPDKTECKTHCDCPQGLYCQAGKCIKGGAPVYCCNKPGCSPNASCYNPDGSVGTCQSNKCNNDADCGKPTCKQQGTQCSEVRPICQPDGTCGGSASVVTGRCDPTTNRCIESPPQCKTHCDCPQGSTCSRGACVPPPPMPGAGTFCCSKPGCPNGRACYNTDGTPGTCPGTQQCKTNADCGKPSCRASGSNCIQSIPTCLHGACSSSSTMQPNAVCSPNGICTPSSQKCKVDCDCPQGQGCVNGQCRLFSGVPRFCCTKPGCVPGNKCTHPDGSAGVCPKPPQCTKDADCGKPSCSQSGPMCIVSIKRCINGQCSTSSSSSAGTCDAATGTCQPAKTCRTPCDCPQGQTCQPGGIPIPGGGGICVKGPTPIYCCDKPGCPSQQRCIHNSGQAGTCPVVCKSPCDCPAGQDCANGKCFNGTVAMYCCDNTSQCPAGALCKNKAGQSGTCPNKPRLCKSACDCIQGEACVNGQCTKSSTPVYCCDNPGCKSGATCVNKLGQTGTCPITCKTHCDCPQGHSCSRGVCSANVTGAYCCSKPGCPANYGCYTTTGRRSRCPVAKCTSPCDCNQGEDCRNGQCTRVYPAVYCCSKSGCPGGQACKDKNNTWGTCPNTPVCKSLCDCPQGQDCYKGQCIRVYPAVYCCSKVGCPAGQACYDANNQPSVCPGNQCTNACDCPNQGQSCVRGRCVYTNPRTFCCSKPGCQPGNVCEDSNGKTSICPGKTCKTACDCNQGEDCRNGVCTRVSPAVYCCSKSPCYPGRACIKSDGSQGTCPIQCKVDCDCNQGYRCYRGACYRSYNSYCCDKPGCPTGATCTNKSGVIGVCGGTTPTKCKTRCDCTQGQDCQGGKCVQTPNRVYCCDKAGCPKGFACRDKNDKPGFCPGITPPPGPKP